MASSGRGSSSAASGNYSGAGKGSYGGSAGVYGKSAASSYAGKSKGLYAKGGLYDGIGTGYGKKGIGFGNRLEGLIPEIADFYLNKSRLEDSYLRELNAKRNFEEMYSLKQTLTNLLMISSQQEIYKNRNKLEQKMCPSCGRDSLICVCRN